MKKWVIILSLLTLFPLSSIFSKHLQSASDDSKVMVDMHNTVFMQNSDIIEALKDGNASKFSKYFNEVLSLKFPDSDEMRSVSKNQASMTMKMFFNDNNIKTFSLSSQRELGSTRYIAGKLIGNKEYNITVMLKEDNGKDNIVSVRIN